MKQPTPIEWLQELYKVTGALKESDFDYANNWTKENTFTEEQVDKAISWGINSGRKGDVTITDIDNFIQSLKQPKNN